LLAQKIHIAENYHGTAEEHLPRANIFLTDDIQISEHEACDCPAATAEAAAQRPAKGSDI